MKTIKYTGHIFLFFICINSNAQRFIGLNYDYMTLQKPTSGDYNLDGSQIAFSNFSADLSYGGYLDKEKEKSLWLATLEYSTSKVHTVITKEELPRFQNEVPSLLYDIPDIHNVGLSLTYNYDLNNKWDLNAIGTVNYSTEGRGYSNNKNYDFFGLLHAERSLKNFNLGLGVTFFIFNGKFMPFPVGSISYQSDKLSLSFMPPLGLDIGYLINKKLMLNSSAGLTFGGFQNGQNYDSTFVDFKPDYIESMDLELSLGFDYNFYDSLHIEASIGYVYRELNYKDGNKNLSSLALENGLLLGAGFYIAF